MRRGSWQVGPSVEGVSRHRESRAERAGAAARSAPTVGVIFSLHWNGPNSPDCGLTRGVPRICGPRHLRSPCCHPPLGNRRKRTPEVGASSSGLGVTWGRAGSRFSKSPIGGPAQLVGAKAIRVRNAKACLHFHVEDLIVSGLRGMEIVPASCENVQESPPSVEMPGSLFI